jgi:probable phosphoglycerate mutase
MPITLAYFVHSTTADNEKHISSGWNDVELSEIGIQQSHILHQTLKGKLFDVIISSDLLRARQTVEIVFPNHPHVLYDARLRECNY